MAVLFFIGAVTVSVVLGLVAAVVITVGYIGDGIGALAIGAADLVRPSHWTRRTHV